MKAIDRHRRHHPPTPLILLLFLLLILLVHLTPPINSPTHRWAIPHRWPAVGPRRMHRHEMLHQLPIHHPLQQEHPQHGHRDRHFMSHGEWLDDSEIPLSLGPLGGLSGFVEFRRVVENVPPHLPQGHRPAGSEAGQEVGEEGAVAAVAVAAAAVAVAVAAVAAAAATTAAAAATTAATTTTAAATTTTATTTTTTTTTTPSTRLQQQISPHPFQLIHLCHRRSLRPLLPEYILREDAHLVEPQQALFVYQGQEGATVQWVVVRRRRHGRNGPNRWADPGGPRGGGGGSRRRHRWVTGRLRHQRAVVQSSFELTVPPPVGGVPLVPRPPRDAFQPLLRTSFFLTVRGKVGFDFGRAAHAAWGAVGVCGVLRMETIVSILSEYRMTEQIRG